MSPLWSKVVTWNHTELLTQVWFHPPPHVKDNFAKSWTLYY